MTFFDETLFVVAPRLYRALDRALDLTAPSRRGRAETEASRDGGRTGTRPVRAHAFVRWGSWVGGDRDGNPHVTADTSIDAVRIGADHVMRGYEAVVRRLMNTITAAVPPDRLDLRLRQGLARDAELVPEAAADLARRFPSEPYRRRLGAIAERIERTRAWLVDGAPVDPAAYLDPGTLGADLESLAGALSAGGLERVAYGELQDLRWQLETFAFHGFSLEVRQHAGAHSGALAALKDGRPADEVAPGVTADEVAATFRAIGAIQGRFGVAACHRYVISFTRSAQDVVDVLELAALSRPDDGGRPELDVVPLFESADALEGSAAILDALLRDPRYREHLRERGDRQELMLGYSDSTKESGGLAAAWMLYRAQEVLLATAHRHGVEVTLFHGRGGAIGRGGGPMSRAIAAQAPGSLRGRLRLTEQGEVIADRYSNGVIALRHLEQLVNAVLLASTDAHEARSRAAGSRGADVLDELADASRRAYRALVWDDPVFETYFRAATPIDELSGMAMGSRPSARRLGPSWTLASLRAIPWVFAWSQSRANLPGWYGLGTALRAYEQAHGAAGVERLRSLYREWPFFSSVLDNAEMSLAKADLQVARRYAGLAPTVESRRVWRRIRGEFLRTEAAILRVNGRERLLDAAPVLQRSIALRNPYVDSLSELQVRLLARLRAMAPDDPDRERVRRLVQLTVSGVAAGVQNTG
jgi:phosphoenolpyruvate carboxylase